MDGMQERWYVPGTHRLGRRRVLRGAVLGGVGLTLTTAGGCSTSKRPAAASPSAKQPKRGGIISYAGGSAGSYDTQGTSFDPDVQTQFASKSFGLFYQRLLGYNPRSFEVEPELAQKFEQPSPTEYIFTLQPGVKWHNKPPVNGRALTVEDVLFSLERARTDDPKFYTRSFLSSVDRIEAPDKSTIRVTTKGPEASTLKKFSIDNLAILSREVLEKNPKPTTADAAVGTGPFVMTAVEEKVRAEYTRNPDYWKPGLPYLDGFRTRHFPELESAWAAFLANQVDVTLTPGPEVKKYISDQGQGYVPDWYADDTFNFQYANIKRKPMDDPRVVRALRLLIDHDEFINSWAGALFGRGGYGSIFPSALGAWDLTDQEFRSQLEWKQPKDDAAKEALTLLAAAGFTRDAPLRFTLDAQTGQQGELGSQLLQSQWKRLSQGVVDAQIKLSDQATINTLRASRSFTFAFLGQSAGMVEPDIWLSTVYRSDGSQNFMGFSDPSVDAMIDKQRTIFDEGQRKAVVKEIVRYMLDHGPSTIGANRFFLQAIKPKVQGHTPEYFLNGRQYQSVWLQA
jgi:peptide/nickel transport system substrate-binding protein